MSALDADLVPTDAEVRREMLRLRFAVSRLRLQGAVAELKSDARRSVPVRAVTWALSPWARRGALLAVAAGLLAGLWRFGWRRPVHWLAEGLSLWQLVQPLIGALRRAWPASGDAPEDSAPAEATAGLPPQAA